MSELNPSGGRLARTVASGVALAALLAATSCTRKLDDAECHKLLDRYTELLAESETPLILPAEIAEKQKEARDAAAHDPRFEFSECPHHVARSSYECAMVAPTLDDMERCLVF